MVFVYYCLFINSSNLRVSKKETLIRAKIQRFWLHSFSGFSVHILRNGAHYFLDGQIGFEGHQESLGQGMIGFGGQGSGKQDWSFAFSTLFISGQDPGGIFGGGGQGQRQTGRQGGLGRDGGGGHDLGDAGLIDFSFFDISGHGEGPTSFGEEQIGGDQEVWGSRGRGGGGGAHLGFGAHSLAQLLASFDCFLQSLLDLALSFLGRQALFFDGTFDLELLSLQSEFDFDFEEDEAHLRIPIRTLPRGL